MIRHHVLDHFLLCIFAAIDLDVGRRPIFVTPNILWNFILKQL